MKTQIICDTNIWYDLGDGSLTFNDNNEHDLIATYINIFEVTNSNNIIDDYKKVRNAVIAIKDYANGFIFESPITHLFNLLNPNNLIIAKHEKPLLLLDFQPTW